MQLWKRIGCQFLALIVFISVSAFTVSGSNCCNKVKEDSSSAQSCACPIHRKSVKCPPQKDKETSSLSGTNFCLNQHIAIQNNSQNPIIKVPMRSYSMPVLSMIQSLFNHWFGSAENIEVNVKPYYILWFQEPLNILFRQFKI